MKTIQEVQITYKKLANYAGTDYIEIKYLDGYLLIANSNNGAYKDICTSKYSLATIANDDTDTANFLKLKQSYKAYSIAELESFQKIMLFAYVFASDELENAVAEKASKDSLDKNKAKVIAIRKHLRYITQYIDAYDEEILPNYKNV